MIVGLHFHHDLDRFIAVTILPVASGHQALPSPALDHGGIVGVSRDDAVGARLGRASNHVEESQVLRLTIDDPVSPENLVTTVFGIRLSKHHEFGVSGITPQICIIGVQIFDFVGR